jgi:hypothetical protein
MPVGLVTDLAVEDSGIPVGVRVQVMWQDLPFAISVRAHGCVGKTVNDVNGDDVVTHGHDVLSSTNNHRASTMLPKCSIWPDE